MAKIFELFNKLDREFAKDELKKMKINQRDDDLVSLMTWQLKYLSELFNIYNSEAGTQDSLIIFGNRKKFEERKIKPSVLKEDEVYDASEKLKMLEKQEYTLVGGLGGFSFFNGEGAGELIMLPGGATIRAEIRGKVYFAQNVPPINIYPTLIMTARKQVSIQKDNLFLVIFEKGESINDAIKELKEKTKTKKTITGAIMGNFDEINGYMFNQASPGTKLIDVKESTSRNLFIYQYLAGSEVNSMENELHTHGYEAAKVMDRTGFGAHIDQAKVSQVALGIFGVVDEIEQVENKAKLK